MIDKNEVKHIAKLSRLEFSEEEIERFSKELSSIVDYVNKMQSLNLDNVEMTYSTSEAVNVFRSDDEVDEKDYRDEILSSAPESEDGYIKVKAIL